MNNKATEQRIIETPTETGIKTNSVKRSLLSILENTEASSIPLNKVSRHDKTIAGAQGYYYTYMIDGQDIGCVKFQKGNDKNVIQLIKLSNINFQINLQSGVNPIDLYDFRGDLSIYTNSVKELQKIYGQNTKIPGLGEHMLRDIMPVIERNGYKYIRVRSVKSATAFYKNTIEKLLQEGVIKSYIKSEDNIWLINLRK